MFKRPALILLIALILNACSDPCKEGLDQAFLDKAAAEEGAIVTESGLIFKAITPGYGPHPNPGDRVSVHYEGRFTDGTVFNDSRTLSGPSSFSLDQVIPGWREGLQLMKGGGKARLVVPPHLGYGKSGNMPDIKPCVILVFEIELLGIKAG
ncbi:MAG: FKBP-type peptidyl-prolyl cis-trans isomerase [Candidatus Latescibacteria bacterium]|nr:FKBP-type peptidyl-prolyl cis-trans isomerase [Candidatus Latescibacterota bacterium]